MTALIDIFSNLEYYKWIILISFIIASLAKPPLKYFRLFLLLCVVFELLLSSWMKYTYGFNAPVYSVYYIICVSYYLYVFGFHHFSKKNKRFILFVMIPLWTLISLFSLFFIGILTINRFNYILGALINIGVVIWYFESILKGSDSTSLLGKPLFILSIGILLLYACGFPIIFHLNSILELDMSTSVYIFDFLVFGNLFLSLSYLYISLWPTIMKKYYIN